MAKCYRGRHNLILSLPGCPRLPWHLPLVLFMPGTFKRGRRRIRARKDEK